MYPTSNVYCSYFVYVIVNGHLYGTSELNYFVLKRCTVQCKILAYVTCAVYLLPFLLCYLDMGINFTMYFKGLRKINTRWVSTDSVLTLYFGVCMFIELAFYVRQCRDCVEFVCNTIIWQSVKRKDIINFIFCYL